MKGDYYRCINNNYFLIKNILLRVFKENVNIAALDLVSLDEKSTSFYEKNGFAIQNYDDDKHLYFYKYNLEEEK